jgi:hypothetical protein
MAAKKRERRASTPLRPGKGILVCVNPEGLGVLQQLENASTPTSAQRSRACELAEIEIASTDSPSCSIMG